MTGAAFEVYNVLGYGMAEEVYQQSLEIELRLRHIPFEPKRRLTLSYKGCDIENRLEVVPFEPVCVIRYYRFAQRRRASIMPATLPQMMSRTSKARPTSRPTATMLSARPRAGTGPQE